MKLKKEHIVLAAIILCLSLYLVFQKTDKTGYSLPDMPKMNSKEISKIEIIKEDDTIMLNRSDNSWSVTDERYSADSDKIGEMLDIISDLKLTALVSESGNFGRYDLNDDKKIHVNAWSKDLLKRSFDIGKAASTNRHTFVRIDNDGKVYHAQKNFRNTFDQPVTALRDKTVLSFNTSDIQEIALTKQNKQILLSLKQAPVEESVDEEEKAPLPEPAWHYADGGEAEKSKVDQLLSKLSVLKCESYTEGKKIQDFSNVEPIYSVKLKGSEEYTMSVFSKTDEDSTGYSGVSSQNKYPFILKDSQAETIMKIFDQKEDKS
jgi:hypothetical protein